MKARVAALATAVVTTVGMLAVFTPGPASAQQAFPGSATFSGSATGTVVHADVLNIPSAPRLVDGEVAFSGEATNTAGLGTGVLNEMNQNVSPALPSKNSYGRGSGLELGLGTTVPTAGSDVNQVLLAGLAQQSAAPVDSFGSTPDSDGVVRKQVGPVPGDPLVYASLLKSEANAAWNPNFCVLGAPLGYGLGYAADAQLLDTGTKNADGSMGAPVVAADTGTPTNRAVSQSRSFTYLRPEPDGTFAVVSETHETIAPITLFKNTPMEIKIELAGEWVLRTISTGKPGGSTVEYAPAGNPTPTTPLVTITPPNAASQILLKAQDLFGPGKIPTQISLPPANGVGPYLAQINVGESPRAPGSQNDPTAPVTSADGTTTKAAVDVVRVDLVVPGTNQDIADVRIGHMEASSVAPSGGIDCPIPVTKTGATTATAGGTPVTWTISIPTAANSLAGTDCDLTNIKATDVLSVINGSGVRATLSNPSNGGVVDAASVTAGTPGQAHWDNLGSYHPGDPPKLVTIQGVIPSTSTAGVIQNMVTVTATLGNCTGGAAGQALIGTGVTITGTANVVGATVSGVAFSQPTSVLSANVLAAQLATTGQKDPWLPVLGGGLLLGALALMRSRRRLQDVRPDA